MKLRGLFFHVLYRSHSVDFVSVRPLCRSWNVQSWFSWQYTTSFVENSTLMSARSLGDTATTRVGFPSGPKTTSPTLSCPCVVHPFGVGTGVSWAMSFPARGGISSISRGLRPLATSSLNFSSRLQMSWCTHPAR